MSKSILVIDTPESCGTCPFCRGWNVCKIMKYLKKEKITSVYTVDHQIFEGSKPDWCPLQDFPGKMSMDNQPFFDKGYIAGRNNCIDELLKGANGNE